MLPDLSIWAIAFAGVGITVFTFTVTFLGDAIQRAQKEEEITKIKKTEDFHLKYTDLQNKMTELKNSGDGTEVKEKVKELEKAQRKFDKEIKKIKNRYQSFHFIHSIAFPGVSYVGSFIFSEYSKSLLIPSYLPIPLWFSSLALLSFGVYKTLRCLVLAQEISLTSEDMKTKMRIAFEEALLAHDKENEEELVVTFHKQSFPLTVTTNTEFRIDFRVTLKNGKIAHNTEIWFFVPDGFDLVKPGENDAWRQADDFVIPQIRTIKIDAGDVVKSTNWPGYITLKSPKVEGNNFILYRVKSNEATTQRSKLELIIK